MDNAVNYPYPLQWPAGWKRTNLHDRQRSRFGKYNDKPTIHRSTQLVIDELRRLTGSSDNIIISTDLKLRNDGLPYSGQREPVDQGVAVYFNMKVDGRVQQMVVACDTFDKIGCNLYAIGKTIEAMRGIDRWGCSELLQRAFTGFKALAAPAQRSCWDVLGLVEDDATEEDIRAAFRNLSKQHHPDMPSGSTAKFQELQFAYDQAMKQKSRN